MHSREIDSVVIIVICLIVCMQFVVPFESFSIIRRRRYNSYKTCLLWLLPLQNSFCDDIFNTLKEGFRKVSMTGIVVDDNSGFLSFWYNFHRSKS